MKIINRYIIKEIAVPFFMILCVLTFVLLIGKILQLMDLMVNKGVSFFHIAQLILYLMPSFLLFTIPISLLIAILIGLGRLSSDNEITIFKASGISLTQLLHPVALASILAFLVTLVTNIYLVPHGNFATKNLLFNVAMQKASIGIKEKVFNDDFKGLLLYAERIPDHGNFMEGVIISDRRMTKDPSTIIAKRAYLISDPRTRTVTLRLENGSTHVVQGNLNSYRKMDFSTYDINLDLAAAASDQKKPEGKVSTEMTAQELVARMNTPGLEKAIARELAIELNKKFTIPLTCVVFGLLGIPLGIRAHRSVKARGFTVGLVVVMVYYIFQLGGEALVETGYMPPPAGTWGPVLLFGVFGLLLLWLAAREKGLPSFRRRQPGATSGCDPKTPVSP